jgi:drug/metabolite transporter (DMT)-like permease
LVEQVRYGLVGTGMMGVEHLQNLAVTPGELGILFIFGALNLGLGMALFVTGARLIPSALAALLGTGETVLGPVWVAVIHGEIPAPRTIAGGVLILAALITHLTFEFRRQKRQNRSNA